MPKKLLLAEDSLTIRKVFEFALSRSDIAITAVDNGEDAVRLAGEIFPDLVVADLTLPGKNGFAVAAELRAMQKTEKIPVLILAGTLVPLDEPRFKASGARGVLFKPFESRELLENVERLLRESATAPEPAKPPAAPAVDERWDFSDVMEEVEAEVGKPVTAAGKGLLTGAILSREPRTPPAFNEFDVSIDEIEGRTPDFSAETPPSAPATKLKHAESAPPVVSSPPVAGLRPAMDEPEAIEGIEHPEDAEVPLPPNDIVSIETPASLRNFPDTTAQTDSLRSAIAEPVVAIPPVAEAALGEPTATRPAVADHAVDASHPEPSLPFIAPSEAGSPPGDAELREFFSVRAAEIFRTVASEAVEKVMWEMTDRLAAEFSAKLRESVEAIAWEVIPSTAETLIREEIARIRSRVGKPSP